MPELINPLAGYRDAYNLLEGQAQDGARRQAGNALAGGNYQGAQDALYGRGMLDEGLAVQQRQFGVQDREMGQQAAQAEAEKKASGERTQKGMAILGWMAGQPEDQLDAIYSSTLRPWLAETLDPEMMARVDAAPKTLANVNLLRAALGAEAEKLTGVSLGRGGYGAFDPTAGTLEVLREPMQEPDDAPTGYRWTESGDLAVINGGPADPRVAGALAGSKRAPPRPRAPGGSGGGGAASSMSTAELLALAQGR
jgi:hypothetical protein